MGNGTELDEQWIADVDREQANYSRSLVRLAALPFFVAVFVHVVLGILNALLGARSAQMYIDLALGESTGWTALGILSGVVIALQVAIRSVTLDSAASQVARANVLNAVGALAAVTAALAAVSLAVGAFSGPSPTQVMTAVAALAAGTLITLVAADAACTDVRLVDAALSERRRTFAWRQRYLLLSSYRRRTGTPWRLILESFGLLVAAPAGQALVLLVLAPETPIVTTGVVVGFSATTAVTAVIGSGSARGAASERRLGDSAVGWMLGISSLIGQLMLALAVLTLVGDQSPEWMLVALGVEVVLFGMLVTVLILTSRRPLTTTSPGLVQQAAVWLMFLEVRRRARARKRAGEP